MRRSGPRLKNINRGIQYHGRAAGGYVSAHHARGERGGVGEEGDSEEE